MAGNLFIIALVVVLEFRLRHLTGVEKRLGGKHTAIGFCVIIGDFPIVVHIGVVLGIYQQIVFNVVCVAGNSVVFVGQSCTGTKAQQTRDQQFTGERHGQ